MYDSPSNLNAYLCDLTEAGLRAFEARLDGPAVRRPAAKVPMGTSRTAARLLGQGRRILSRTPGGAALTRPHFECYADLHAQIAVVRAVLAEYHDAHRGADNEWETTADLREQEGEDEVAA